MGRIMRLDRLHVAVQHPNVKMNARGLGLLARGAASVRRLRALKVSAAAGSPLRTWTGAVMYALACGNQSCRIRLLRAACDARPPRRPPPPPWRPSGTERQNQRAYTSPRLQTHTLSSRRAATVPALPGHSRPSARPRRRCALPAPPASPRARRRRRRGPRCPA